MDKEDTSEVDAAALLPPIETFMKVDQDDRASHFFDVVSTFDILLCRVIISLTLWVTFVILFHINSDQCQKCKRIVDACPWIRSSNGQIKIR